MDRMDFSREGRFREELLRRIKAKYFSALEDDDLELVNAAGEKKIPGMMETIMPEEME